MAERRISWETDIVCGKKARAGCAGKLKILFIIGEESDSFRQKLENSQTFITCPSCGMMASGKLVLDHINTGTPMPTSMPTTSCMSSGSDDTTLSSWLDGEPPDGPDNFLRKGINCIEPFDPTTFIGQNWNVWKGPINSNGLSGEEEIDSRSLALTTLDPAKLLFEICLRPACADREKEETSTGEEKLKRLKKNPHLIRLGGNVFLALWENYQTDKKNSILEWFYRTKKITYLDFFGLVLRDLSGHRYVLHLSRPLCGGGRWGWHYRWLGHDWDASRFSAGAQICLSKF